MPARSSWPSRSTRRSCSARSASATTRSSDRVLHPARRVRPGRRRERARPRRPSRTAAASGVFLTRGQVAGASCEHAGAARRRRPADLRVVRAPDGPGRPHLPAHELMRGRPTPHARAARTRRDRRSRAACRGAATRRSSSTSSTRRRRACQAIYKPLRGERPLWDFEPGLHRRELAAYRLSEAMGSTSCRRRSSATARSARAALQWFVDADHQQHYFTIHESRADLHDVLRAVAVFDLLANNTDRKSGHVLIDARRPHLGHRPRAVLRRRLQAAHGRVGVRRRAGARPTASTRRGASPSVAARRSPRCSPTTRSRRCTSARGWIVEHPRAPRRPLRPPLPLAARLDRSDRARSSRAGPPALPLVPRRTASPPARPAPCRQPSRSSRAVPPALRSSRRPLLPPVPSRSVRAHRSAELPGARTEPRLPRHRSADLLCARVSGCVALGAEHTHRTNELRPTAPLGAEHTHRTNEPRPTAPLGAEHTHRTDEPRPTVDEPRPDAALPRPSGRGSRGARVQAAVSVPGAPRSAWAAPCGRRRRCRGRRCRRSGLPCPC